MTLIVAVRQEACGRLNPISLKAWCSWIGERAVEMEDKTKCLGKNEITGLDARLKDPRPTRWLSRLWFSWRWGICEGCWEEMFCSIIAMLSFLTGEGLQEKVLRDIWKSKSTHSADTWVPWLHMNQRKIEKSSVVDCCYQDGTHMWASGQGERSWILRDGPFKSTVQTQCLWYIHLKL